MTVLKLGGLSWNNVKEQALSDNGEHLSNIAKNEQHVFTFPASY